MAFFRLHSVQPYMLTRSAEVFRKFLEK